MNAAEAAAWKRYLSALLIGAALGFFRDSYQWIDGHPQWPWWATLPLRVIAFGMSLEALDAIYRWRLKR